MRAWNPLLWLHLARYYWIVCRGYRFCPWRSPYLRWRIETHWGIPSDRMDRQQMWHLLRKDFPLLIRFGGWTQDMRRYL